MASKGLSYRILPHVAGWRWQIILNRSIVVAGDELTSAAARAQAWRAFIELEEAIDDRKST
jgi:hypothetical protein